MSFLKDIIDKVENVTGNHQQQNAHYSSSHGFNPQEQYGGPQSQQSKTDFHACRREQYYGEIPFLGQPPYNPYQDGYQQRGPPASYPYQEGYGRSTHNYQGGPPPPYENRGQFDMTRQQWGEEHHRNHSPRQFEGREGEHYYNQGYNEGHERGRNHPPEEHRYQHHPEGHGHEHHHEHGHGHQQGHHQEHERRRSHSRD